MQANEQQLLALVEDAYSYLRFMPLRTINNKLRAALVADGRIQVPDTKRRPAGRKAASAAGAVRGVGVQSQCEA